MKPVPFAALLLPLAALAARPLCAQVDSVGPLHAAVTATPPMKRVRVELHDGRRLEGILADPTAASLSLTDTAAHTSQAIPQGDVARYWVRGHAAGTGAIVGAVIGGTAGGLFGLGTIAWICEEDGCGAGSYIIGGALGAAAGAAVTAGVGAIIGSIFPRYHLKWKDANAR